MSYYRMSGIGRLVTPKTPCANCTRPLKEHRTLSVSRWLDGDLRQCPEKPKIETPTGTRNPKSGGK